MTPIVTHSQAKLATRSAFIAAGFGVACWAPLVPYAKAGCQLYDGTMGLVLLLLAAGSILAMPLAAISAPDSAVTNPAFGWRRIGDRLAPVERGSVTDLTRSSVVRLRCFIGVVECCNEFARGGR